MSRIDREVSFEHGGKSYSVVASNRLISKIDGELRNMGPLGFMGTLAEMEKAAMAAQKDPQSVDAQNFPVFQLAFVISEVMNAAGCKISEDDVFDDMMLDFQENSGKDTAPIIEKLARVVSPQSAEKNLPAPAKRVRGKAKSKS